MFEGFAKVWTPVMRAADLRNRPAALTVAGQRIVLFRGATGKASALVDRCPHRGAALSAGTVVDGCLECPFHGWRFDGEGRVRRVPFAPDARVDNLAAVSLPTFEAAGILFLYTAPRAEAPSPPALAEALADWGDGRPSLREDLFRAHWTRAIENALDFPHVAFVHKNTIGAGMRKAALGDARMETHWEETSFGARLTATVDDGPAGELEYFYPNVMRLVFPGRKPDSFLAAVPVDARSTRMLAFGPPSFSLGRWLFKTTGGFVLQQDRRVVEGQEPPEVPPAGTELSVRIDRATLSFRKLYDARLRHSSAACADDAAPPEPSP